MKGHQSTQNDLYSDSNLELDSAILNTDSDLLNQNPAASNNRLRFSGVTKNDFNNNTSREERLYSQITSSEQFSNLDNESLFYQA